MGPFQVQGPVYLHSFDAHEASLEWRSYKELWKERQINLGWKG